MVVLFIISTLDHPAIIMPTPAEIRLTTSPLSLVEHYLHSTCMCCVQLTTVSVVCVQVNAKMGESQYLLWYTATYSSSSEPLH